jgi:DNA-directed RNA polymerase subunit RPC12/RpoP
MYDKKELTKLKEEADKRLLKAEVVIGLLSIALMLVLIIFASLVQMEDWVRCVLIAVSVVQVLAVCPFMLKIEQTAGYYECAKCKAKHVPKYKTVFWAPHIGRTRYMKCPHCGKKSWHKKRLV